MNCDVFQDDLLSLGTIFLVDFNSLNLIQNAPFLCTINDLSEDGVLSIEMGLLRVCDEELGFIGVGVFARVGHGDDPTSVEL